MKYILILLLTFVGFSNGYAQGKYDKKRPSRADHEKIEELKRSYFSEELDLSKEDSVAFWPVYMDYSSRLRKLHHDIKTKYRCKESSKLSEESYKKIIQEIIALEEKELKLKAEYMLKIGETIGYEKALRLPCLEHEFRRKLLSELRERRKQ